MYRDGFGRAGAARVARDDDKASSSVADSSGDPLGTAAAGAEHWLATLNQHAVHPTPQSIDGTDGDDELGGTDGNDTINGFGGSDILYGAGGNDTLNGGAGTDYLEGGLGNDKLNGDADFDFATYILASSGVTVTLTIQGVAQNTGSNGSDTLNSIEGLFGSDYNDTLTGDGNDNILVGLAGADTLIGGAGDDLFLVNAAGDFASGESYDGGDDYDAVVFAENVDLTASSFLNMEELDNQNHTVRLTAAQLNGLYWLDTTSGAVTITGSGMVDLTFANITTTNFILETGGITLDMTGSTGNVIHTVTGSSGADTVYATQYVDILNGNAGNDTLSGADGADVIDGGADDDHIDGGAGFDLLTGGTGNDTIDGGDGSDNITGNDGNDIITGGAGDDQIDGGANDDRIDGNAGNDSILGGAGNDTINGGDGNDTLSANGGSDTISGGDGNDSIYNGDGNDVYGSGGGTLSGDGGNDRIWAGTGATANGGAGDDELHGKGATLNGDEGNDTLTVVGGDNTLNGGAGDDNLHGGAGSDNLNGGEGNDTLMAGVDFSTELPGAINQLHGDGGSDTLYVGVRDSVIDGGSGDDLLIMTTTVIYAGAQLSGGAGIDTLRVGFGDTVDLSGIASDHTIEKIIGGADSTILRITAAGLQGVTTLQAREVHITGAGVVDLSAAAGASMNTGIGFYLDVGGVTLNFSGYTGPVGVQGSAGDDVVVGGNSYNSIAGNAGNDTITGGTLGDFLYGGGDNDTITGGAGDDTLDLGDGSGDTVVFSGARTNYSIAYDADPQKPAFIVTDLRGGSPDGTDTVYGTEFLRFSDGTVSAASLIAVAPPLLKLARTTTTFTEQTPAFIDGNASVAITDANSDTLVRATVTISGGFMEGDRLSPVTYASGMSFSWDNATHTATYTGNVNLDGYAYSLFALQFVNSGDNPDNYGTNTTRTLTWKLDDGHHQSVPVVTTVNVVAVNDAPLIAGDGNTQTYTGSPLAIDPALTVTDPDNFTIAGATVTITDFFTGDQLNFTNQNGITGNFNAATHILTLSGNTTVANYQTALRSVTYSTTNANPGPAGHNTRTISWIADDGQAANHASTAGTSTIIVSDIDSAPVLGGGGNSVNYAPHDAPITLDPALTVSDADNTMLVGASVSFGGNGYFTGDMLDVAGVPGGIQCGFIPETHVLLFWGTASVADYQTALRKVTYSSTSNDPTNGTLNPSRTLVWQVDDGQLSQHHLSNTVTTTIVLPPGTPTPPSPTPNVAPKVVNGSDPSSYTEHTAPVVIADALAVSDADTANLVKATVTIAAGFVAGDTLTFVNQSGIVGAYNATSHALTLTGSASPAAYANALSSVTFSSTSDDPDNGGANPTRTITFQVDDGQSANHASNTVSQTLNVVAVADAPGLHNDAFATTEQAVLGEGQSLFANNGSGTDSAPGGLHIIAVNGSPANVGIQITLASGALLTVNANGTFTYDPNHAFDALSAPGSGASDTQATDIFNYSVNGTTEFATVTVTGVDSDDVLHGTSANNTFDGGIGNDALVFTGNRANYAISFDDATHAYTIVDQRSGHPDGTDTARNIESFRFADGTINADIWTTFVNNPDGSSVTTFQDASAGRPWASKAVAFDNTGSVLSQSIVLDNGNKWVNTYDAFNTSAFLWKSAAFDAAGHQLSESGTNDNGTHYLTLNDVANVYRWTTATISFDVNWNQTGIAGTNDDGSHTITFKDVAAAYDTLPWFAQPYDAEFGGAPVFQSGLGGAHADYIVTFAGNDVLLGDGGDDILIGNGGNDQYSGGSGADRFVFHNGDGRDVISDFQPTGPGNDLIELHGYDAANFTALQALMTQVGGDVVITFDPMNTITLQHVTLAQLSAGDFAFG